MNLNKLYKDLYFMCQNRADLHKQTNETDKAEAEMSQVLKSLDPETMEKMDDLLGRLPLLMKCRVSCMG
mgnify:CR=1 FL=1